MGYLQHDVAIALQCLRQVASSCTWVSMGCSTYREYLAQVIVELEAWGPCATVEFFRAKSEYRFVGTIQLRNIQADRALL
jgi:hypothetical protein